MENVNIGGMLLVLTIYFVFLFIYINQLINVDKRFQESNKMEQLWRYRFYVHIPFLWVWYMITEFKVYRDEMVDGKIVHTLNYEVCRGSRLWKLLIGLQQGKMEWYHTSEEVLSKIKGYK
jgi:hypothetical protein